MYSMNEYSDIGNIAIIGMSCRFPGAKSIEEFWQNLANGVESLSSFSDEELLEAGVDPSLLRHPKYIKAGYILDGVDMFDASFFNFNPREVQIMDPQHRLFIECSWEAIESAGYSPETSDILIGVYAGTSMSTYLLNNLIANPHQKGLASDLQILLANEKDYLCTRVSYKLNLKGPSVGVQTACSTSLVAVCQACESLLDYQCDMALAGGVTVKIPQKVGYIYEEGNIFSPDGHCRAFDARAQGTVFGSGVGVVVLKRLMDAIADRDCIHAVIKGTAVNNDGASKIGFTAPGVEGQSQVIAIAQAMAGVEVETITYVEAHGTGTPLGDPIEVAALTQVFRAATQKRGFCAIGSVKTNVGHLEAAAGVASLIKTVLALKHKLIPASLHFEQANPEIDFTNTPFYVNTVLSEWKTNGAPRRAGVSSFGMGGTNAHIILEEAPVQKIAPTEPERPMQILTLSAKTEEALKQLAGRYESYLCAHPYIDIGDICFTANVGCSHFQHRMSVMASSSTEVCKSLSTFYSGQKSSRVFSGHSTSPPKVAFLFTGQGSQYTGMGRQLYETQPTFRRVLNRCNEILRPYLKSRGIIGESPLISLLYSDRQQAVSGDPEIEKPTDSLLNETAYTQPALFALEYALAELWKSWGVVPTIVMGHSVGEYVAACVAGVFSLEDGLKLIAERGRLMQSLPYGGKMVAVLADEAQVAEAIKPYIEEVSIAAVNGPRSVVVSGATQAVGKVVATLEEKGSKSKKLNVSHAFHSPLMAPLMAFFQQKAEEITFFRPQIDIISNVTGQLATDEIATPEYWVGHIRQTVRFFTGMETLSRQGCEVFLEIGPNPVLLGMGRHCLPYGTGDWLPSLQQGESDWQQILHSLGKLYVRGVPINWSGFDRDYLRYRVMLPTYPFQRERYWVDRVKYPTPQRNGGLFEESTQNPILNLLLKGDTGKLARYLEIVEKASNS